MTVSREIGKRFGAYATASIVGAALLFSPVQAHAENKDMIRLQTQVQALQEAVARLQQSNDERMGVLRDLVQQTADAVNRMSVTVTGLKQQMDSSREAVGAKQDQVAGQVQALNDSLDELKARMGRMEKMLGDVQSTQQQMGANMQGQPVAAGPAPSSAAPPAGPIMPSNAAPVADNSGAPVPGSALPMPDSAGPAGARGARPVASASHAPGVSVGDMYRGAYSDFMAGKQQLAMSEFNDLVRSYPDENLSGNAYFYMGEIELRGNHPAAAIRDYDQVIERYPGNAKIPAAHLHKAQALNEMRQAEAANRELRALITRFPASPEAAQARGRLGRR